MSRKESHELTQLKFIKDSYENAESYSKRYMKYSKYILIGVLASALGMGYLSKMYSINETILSAIYIVSGILIGLSIYFQFSSKNISLLKKYNLINIENVEKQINKNET